ncbi:boophilin-G2 [Trichonephila inaurata madagascariensis]|uniref:Boophilin-G2 n=1 Tax=Trichonephila inaurata madagascariensis TaxID=2747483 RepID=A0A8X7CBX6_9ARAC|nr:boophilin-G2 [Trichonephila inaurata madagascariensis]
MKFLILFVILLTAVISKGDEERKCTKPVDEGGPCLARIPMFYYDFRTKSCQKFFWKGCGGNDNKFNTKEDCEAECGKEESYVCTLPVNKGICSNEISRWYHDFQSHQCKEFTYTGCHGNANNFETEQECELMCPNE